MKMESQDSTRHGMLLHHIKIGRNKLRPTFTIFSKGLIYHARGFQDIRLEHNHEKKWLSNPPHPSPNYKRCSLNQACPNAEQVFSG